jgi:hypothetical protein
MRNIIKKKKMFTFPKFNKAHDFVIGQPNLKSKPDKESTVF